MCLRRKRHTIQRKGDSPPNTEGGEKRRITSELKELIIRKENTGGKGGKKHSSLTHNKDGVSNFQGSRRRRHRNNKKKEANRGNAMDVIGRAQRGGEEKRKAPRKGAAPPYIPQARLQGELHETGIAFL